MYIFLVYELVYGLRDISWPEFLVFDLMDYLLGTCLIEGSKNILVQQYKKISETYKNQNHQMKMFILILLLISWNTSFIAQIV